MNRFLGPASLAVSVLALAVAFWSPRSPQGEEAPYVPPRGVPIPTAAAPSSQELKDLEIRVEMLEENALSLSRRLMQLEQRPASAGTAGGPVAPAALASEVQRLRSEIQGLTAGQALRSDEGREALKGAVRSVQDEMRNEQREQREERMMQSMARAQAQQAERVRRFAVEARLSSSQERDVTRHLENESTQRQALFDAARAGGDGQNVRQQVRQLREQTDTQIKAVLDESQQAQFETMRREERRGGRGPGAGLADQTGER